MGAKLHESTRQDGTHYAWLFYCPGCRTSHVVPTGDPKGWDFNGNTESPTFSPSILLYGDAHAPRCHSFVRDGRIEYCADSTHAMAGQSVDLPDWASVREPYG